MTKTCSGCNQTRPTTEFYSNKSRVDGLANECKHCAAIRRASTVSTRKEYDSRRYQENRDEVLQVRKAHDEDKAYEIKMYWIKKKYTLSAEDYEDMLRSQNYKCAIDGCFRSAFLETLVVDHDHSCCSEKGISCGRCVRGLICGTCNLALGMLRDNKRVMRGMINYLGEEV